MSATRTLLLIRNRTANTWEALCAAYGQKPDAHEYSSEASVLWYQLQTLKAAGLIEFGESWPRQPGASPIAGPIVVSDAWERIQRALQISLTQIAALDPHQDLIVRPFFGRPTEVERKRDVFVLMPFSQTLRPLYDDHVKKVCDLLGLTVGRADDFFSAHAVIKDVWNGISFARAIVADCTGRNPNVFYEIGLAHVLGKPVVLITQNHEDVPFDLRHIRFIQYNFTPRGMADFEATLSGTLRNVLSLD